MSNYLLFHSFAAGLATSAQFITFCVGFLNSAYYCCQPSLEREIIWYQLDYSFIVSCCAAGFYYATAVAAVVQLVEKRKKRRRLQRAEEEDRLDYMQSSMQDLSRASLPAHMYFPKAYVGY